MNIRFEKNNQPIGTILERSSKETLVSIGNFPLRKEKIVYLMNQTMTDPYYLTKNDNLIQLLPVSEELLDVQIKAFLYFRHELISYKKNKPKKASFELASSTSTKKLMEENKIIIDYLMESKRIIDIPSNEMYPQNLLDYILSFSKDHGLNVLETYDEKRLQKENFNGVYIVGKGSRHQPRMAVIEYNGTGNKDTEPVVLVGKGITFDSGGYSLKEDSKNMKQDKTGAVIIICLLGALSKLKIKCRVIAILPLAENVIGKDSFKPDDIIMSRSGTSVEVFNTDAEGRLLLMDGLSLGYEYNPKVIIDVATLTGVNVFCHKMGAIFSNKLEAAWEIQKLGDKYGEPFWVLPLIDSLIEDTKHDTIADIKNEGFSCTSSTMMAASFLHNFVSDKIPWIHIDVGESRNIYEAFDSTNNGKGNSFLTLFYFLTSLG